MTIPVGWLVVGALLLGLSARFICRAIWSELRRRGRKVRRQAARRNPFRTVTHRVELPRRTPAQPARQPAIRQQPAADADEAAWRARCAAVLAGDVDDDEAPDYHVTYFSNAEYRDYRRAAA